MLPRCWPQSLASTSSYVHLCSYVPTLTIHLAHASAWASAGLVEFQFVLDFVCRKLEISKHIWGFNVIMSLFFFFLSNLIYDGFPTTYSIQPGIVLAPHLWATLISGSFFSWLVWDIKPRQRKLASLSGHGLSHWWVLALTHKIRRDCKRLWSIPCYGSRRESAIPFQLPEEKDTPKCRS